jgi:hypothetical protein
MEIDLEEPSRPQLAAVFQVSSRWIGELRSQGKMPADGASLLENIEAWAAIKYGGAAADPEALDKEQEQARLAKEQADAKAMDNAERRRELASLPDMVAAGAGVIVMIVAQLQQVGARVAKGDTKLRARVDAEINNVLSQEFRYVPCPHCGEMQQLVFGDGTGAGIRWEPKENPTRAWYRCVNGCDIDEADKAAMDEAGEWRAHNPAAFPRHRSFHIWAAYSQHPGAAWLEIAREFMEVRKDPNLLRTFVNQVLGEAWAERGEAPEWQRLYDRREKAMRLGTPSAKAGLLVGAADVQRGGGGRIDLDIWAFGPNGRREFVERIEVFGPISDKKTWKKLDVEVARTWETEDGRSMRLARVAIDSGDGENTMEVYAWARRHPGFAMAVKGRHQISANQPIGSPTWQDVTVNGRKLKRGVRLWNIGTSMLKLELFGDLEKDKPVDGEGYPDGYRARLGR